MRAITLSLFLTSVPLLPHGADAAVVVTCRGNNPNVLPLGLTGATLFDINGDGTNDFRFSSNGFFASFDTLADNRVSAFIDTTGFFEHQIVPVEIGYQIGPSSAFPYFGLPGAWHSADEIPTYVTGFLLGYETSGFMQFSNAHIAVEFRANNSIHYGWIQYTGFGVAQVPLVGPNGEILGHTMGISQPGGFVDSWGWETEPGVPILAGQVPEPTSSVLIWIGLAMMLARRYRNPRHNQAALDNPLPVPSGIRKRSASCGCQVFGVMPCKLSASVWVGLFTSVLGAAEETALTPVAAATDAKPLVLKIGVNDIYCRKTACECISTIAIRSYDGVLAELAKQHGITLEFTYFMEVMDLDKAILARRFDGVLCKPWTALRHAKESGANFKRVADLLDPDNVATMTGWIVVPTASPLRTLADLNGKRLVFGQPDSYEKHAAPLQLLAAAGVKPVTGEYFSSCGENLDALMNGTVDAAVISSYALSASCAVDFAKPEDFRTIAKTAEMPLTSLLVDLGKVPPAAATRLQRALLAVSGDRTPKDLCGKGFVAPLPWQPVAAGADITPKTPPPADP